MFLSCTVCVNDFVQQEMCEAPHTSIISLPEISITSFSLSSFFMHPHASPFILFHFSLSPLALYLLSFTYFFKLSSGSTGAFNRMCSLSKDTFAFSNRKLQLSVRLSAAREQCWRGCPLNFDTYFNTRLCLKVRLRSSARAIPRRSHTTLLSCWCCLSFPSVHWWMCHLAIWFLYLPEEVRL